jgi:hypothetical protein
MATGITFEPIQQERLKSRHESRSAAITAVF